MSLFHLETARLRELFSDQLATLETNFRREALLFERSTGAPPEHLSDVLSRLGQLRQALQDPSIPPDAINKIAEIGTEATLAMIDTLDREAST